MNDIKPLIEKLNATYAAIRAEFAKRYLDGKLNILAIQREALTVAGFDLDKVAPHPRSNVGRRAYREAIAARAAYSKSFKTDSTRGVGKSYIPGEPHYVVEREDSVARPTLEANQEANAIVDAYIHKLASKIGKPIDDAATNGRIWDYAMLTVVCTDGEVQTWRTKCILNVSCLGKLFNQWPTRRTA